MDEIKIEYRQPRFYRRVLASVVDALLFALAALLLFIGIKAAADSTPAVKKAQTEVAEVQKNCGLYVKGGDGRLFDIVSYYKDDKNLNDGQYRDKLSRAIDDFIAYLGSDEMGLGEAQAKVRADYDDYRLGENMEYEGVRIFVKNSDGKVVFNQECTLGYRRLADEIYAPYIDQKCMGFLVTEIPNYREHLKLMSNVLLFVELPLAFVLGGILVYLVPPLFLRRGRRTLGKALYRISAVDSRCLSLKTGRFLARFGIFFFGIVTLSMFTLGVPLLISFSLMAFSKNRQSFPDYMLGIREVDSGDQKVYFSFEEIRLEQAKKTGKSPDFKMEDRL